MEIAPTITRRRAALVFGVTSLGAFMAALDVSIVNVAFPDLRRSYPGASAASLSWVITAYAIVYGSLLVTAGRTADRFGRRRTFLLGAGVFLSASLLCGIAPGIVFLVASRAIQGVGAALLVPSSLALLIASVPQERRTHVVAQWGGIGALAVATGPSLGAAIVSAGGWRWAFFVNIPIGLFVIFIGGRVLGESERVAKGASPDYLGVVLLSMSLGALVLAISEGTGWGWSDPRIVGAFAFVAIAGTTFVLRSRHHPEPAIDLTLLADRSFVVANTATVVYAAGFFAMLLGNVLFLTGVWHFSIMRAGLAITPGPLVVAAIAGSAGKLATRVGFRRVLLVGAACFASGLAWYAIRVGATPHYWSVWLPGTLMVGLGIGLTFPVLSAAAVSSLPAHRFGVGSAVNQTARQIGGAIGIAILVLILGTPNGPAQAVSSFHHLWTYGALTALGSGAIGWFFPVPVR